MKRFTGALFIAAALAVPMAASATVLSFDDIGQDGSVPLNYGGLDWSAGGWSVFGIEQAPYTPHSGSSRATANWDATDAMTRIGFAAPTTFQGAWFSGYSDASLHFDLYLGGQLVASSDVLDPSATPTFLSSGYTGLVDAVVVSSLFQSGYTMDDFTFAQAVPEPGTLALLLPGLGLIGGFAARRRSRG